MLTQSYYRIFQSRILFAICLIIIFYGLFLVPNSPDSSRTWNEIWNLGHVGAFLLCWTFAFNLFPRIRRLSFAQVIIVVLVSTLLLGELIEIVQGWIGRDNEWQDVWDSGVGAMLALTFTSPQIQVFTRWSRTLWRVVALIVLLVVPWRIWSALADEVIIRYQVPVLCDFSTPFELRRWHASVASIRLAHALGSGQAYMAVTFRPAKYSTISLQYFYPDWRGYNNIVLDLVNPEAHGYHVIIRMNDRQHRFHHYAFNDRFNRVLDLQPGRQQIVISLAKVKNAPASRSMDMQHMQDLSIFTMRSKTYHHLYIQKIYLE